MSPSNGRVRMWKRCLGFALAVSLALVPATVHAKSKNSQGFVYQSSQDCHWGRAYIQDSFGGYLESERRAYSGSSAGNCTTALYRNAPGMRVQYVARKAVNGSWVACVNSGQRYLQSGAEWRVQLNYAGFASACGTGCYRTDSYGAHYFNGSWHGGRRSTTGLCGIDGDQQT